MNEKSARHTGRAIVLGVLLTFLMGSVTAGLAWEVTNRAWRLPVGWIIGAYAVFLAISWVMLLLGARYGAFRDLEAAKYPILQIREEPESFLDDGARRKKKQAKGLENASVTTTERQQP